MGNGQIVEVVRVRVHAPRRDLVQQRLPQVRRILIDERDVRAPATAEALSESRRQRQSAGAAADDDHAMDAWRLNQRSTPRLCDPEGRTARLRHHLRPPPASARPTRRSVSTCDLSAKS